MINIDSSEMMSKCVLQNVQDHGYAGDKAVYMRYIYLLDGKYKDTIIKFPPWRPFKAIPCIENYAKRKGFNHFSVYRPNERLHIKYWLPRVECDRLLYAHYDSGKTIEVGILSDDIVSLPDYKNEEEKDE